MDSISARAAERSRLLELVTRLGALSALRLPAEGLLREAAQTAQQLTRATGAVLAIGVSDSLEYAAAYGALERHIGFKVPLAGSLSGFSLRHRELAYSADTENDPRVHLERARETGARSMMVAPLLQGADAIGVLKVISDRAEAFDEIDEHACQMCAQFAAGVLARQTALDERDRLLAEHRDDLARLQTILDASPAATMVHDLDGRIQFWNAAAERLLGWKRDEVMGRLPPFVPQGQMAGFLEISGRIVRGEQGWLGPLPRLRKDGSPILLRVTGSPLLNTEGVVMGLVRVLEKAAG